MKQNMNPGRGKKKLYTAEGFLITGRTHPDPRPSGKVLDIRSLVIINMAARDEYGFLKGIRYQTSAAACGYPKMPECQSPLIICPGKYLPHRLLRTLSGDDGRGIALEGVDVLMPTWNSRGLRRCLKS